MVGLLAGGLLLSSVAPAWAAGPGTDPAPEPPPVLIALREADERRRAFEPKGAHLGAARIDLSLSLGAGHTDNIYGTATDAEAATLYSAEADATMAAGSAAYRLTVNGRVAALRYPGYGDLDHLRGGLAAALAMDSWNRSTLDLETGWDRRVEMPGDPDLPGAAGAPVPLDVWRGGGDLLVRRGLWLAGVEGRLRRLNYYDTAARGGGDLDQDDRDRWESDVALRGGFGPWDALDVYVALEESLRLYDRPAADTGLWRDSTATTLWGGLRFERSERLALEAAYGRAQRVHVTPFFAPVVRPVWRLAAQFAVTPMTALTGAAWQRLEETASAGHSATLARGWQLGLSHELLRNLTFGGLWRREREVYLGPAPDRRDRRIHGALSVDWRATPRWGLSGEVGWWQTDSSFDIFDMRRRRVSLRLTAHL